MGHRIKGDVAVNGVSVFVDVEIDPEIVRMGLVCLFGLRTPPPSPIVEVAPQPALAATVDSAALPPVVESKDSLSLLTTDQQKEQAIRRLAGEIDVHVSNRTIEKILDPQRFKFTEENLRHYLETRKTAHELEDAMFKKGFDHDELDPKLVWALARLINRNRLTIDEAINHLMGLDDSTPRVRTLEEKERATTDRSEEKEKPTLTASEAGTDWLQPLDGAQMSDTAVSLALKKAHAEKEAKAATTTHTETPPASNHQNGGRPIAQLEGLTASDIKKLEKAGITTIEVLATTRNADVNKALGTYHQAQVRVKAAAEKAGITIPGQRQKKPA
ncbi:MAG: hypothetical protein WAP74_04100 [Patescibacteria group bacterium]